MLIIGWPCRFHVRWKSFLGARASWLLCGGHVTAWHRSLSPLGACEGDERGIEGTKTRFRRVGLKWFKCFGWWRARAQGREKVALFIDGGVTGKNYARKRFSPFKWKRQKSIIPPPLCGIIKDGDAKDSLIRFFNYWGFTSSSIVAQLRKLIKQRGDEEEPPPPLCRTIFLHLLFLSSAGWQKRLTCAPFDGWAWLQVGQGSSSLMNVAGFSGLREDGGEESSSEDNESNDSGDAARLIWPLCSSASCCFGLRLMRHFRGRKVAERLTDERASAPKTRASARAFADPWQNRKTRPRVAPERARASPSCL